jgi:hypothetical protein
MTAAPARSPGVRHVWAQMTGGYVYPGLLISWRRGIRGWEAQVAVVMRETVLVRWLPESRIRPVSDDGWQR